MVVRVSIKCPVPSQLSLSESLACLNVDAWPPCKMQLFQLGYPYKGKHATWFSAAPKGAPLS